MKQVSHGLRADSDRQTVSERPSVLIGKKKGRRNMAIDAKVSLQQQLENRLMTEVTADTMNRMLRIVADVLEGFDVREISPAEEQDDLLDCYLNAMRVQGRSEKTLARYKFIIEKMMQKVGVSTRRITVYHLRAYLAGLKEAGRQDSTMEGERQIFSAYFNWLQRESLIDKNPTANLGAIKCAKKQKKILSDIDMEKLKQGCKCKRDRAIIAFLASTGCRVSELTELDRDAVDLDGLTCVVHGKGNKERRVYLDGVTGMLVRAYLAERKDFNQALFVNRYHDRMKADGVREMLTRVAAEAGVEHVHPHKFRRTLATNMARHGMPVQEVARILGHDKIDTTMEYVMLNDDEIKHEYMKFA